MVVKKICELCGAEYESFYSDGCSGCENNKNGHCQIFRKSVRNKEENDCIGYEEKRKLTQMDVCDDCEYVINVACVEAVEGIMQARGIKREHRMDVEDAICLVFGAQKGII